MFKYLRLGIKNGIKFEFLAFFAYSLLISKIISREQKLTLIAMHILVEKI